MVPSGAGDLRVLADGEGVVVHEHVGVQGHPVLVDVAQRGLVERQACGEEEKMKYVADLS